MKEEIRAYLQGPRDYREGVALYSRYGINLMLKRRFAIDESDTTKAVMIEELRKLAGLDENQFRNLKRKAVKRPAPVRPSPREAETPVVTIELKKAPETVKKMIRFREQFPFLSEPECPDILKILVSDMFTAYGNYKAARERLENHADENAEVAARDCETVVEEYLKNREIWEELEYYRQTGEILGKAAKFREIEQAEALSKLTDMELLKKQQSAQVNVSKRKKALKKAEDEGNEVAILKESEALRNWTDKKLAIEEEIEKRKKK